MNRRQLKYLWPSNKRREEHEMQEELASLAAMGEPCELGNLTLAAEAARQTWHLTSFTGVAADIRYALRALGREPGFLAVAVLSVALGVGANTAVFSFVDAHVLRPLPLPHASEVLRVSNSTPNARVEGISYPDFRDVRGASRSFSGLVAFRVASLRVALDPQAASRLQTGMIVSSDFFTVLDIIPPLGRTFLPETSERSSELPSAVLGHDFWLREFGGDRSAVGRTLRINAVPFVIAGVAPEWFPGIGTAFSRRPAVFVPLAVSDRLEGARASPLEDRSRHDLSLAGRLRAGVSLASAQAELSAIAAHLEHEHPETNRERRLVLRTELGMRLAEDLEMPLFSALLLTLVALVLLVAYAGGAARLAAPLRAVVHGLDTGHPVPEVRTLESYNREAERAMSTIVGWFIALGLIGLGLAVVGLYALIAYSVNRRTSEIGLRMAIGSTRAGVMRLVLREGLAVAATGVAPAALVVGLAHAALDGSFYADAIVTMFPPNAPTYVGVPLAVLAICAIAAWVPARRAASIDPLEALRQE